MLRLKLNQLLLRKQGKTNVIEDELPLVCSLCAREKSEPFLSAILDENVIKCEFLIIYRYVCYVWSMLDIDIMCLDITLFE